MNEALNFSQQHNIFKAAHARPVTVIGVGAVGSQAAVMLAKIGVDDLTVMDADDVESHNIPMSAYGVEDLSCPKVEAISRIIARQSGLAVRAVNAMYGGAPLRGAVVACVDSMEARAAIWKAVKMDPNVEILVDTRVATELVSVFAVNPCDPDDIAYYEHFHYPSSEAVKPMCGVHGIIHVGALAALAVVSNLTNWWTNGRKERHFTMLAGTLEVPR